MDSKALDDTKIESDILAGSATIAYPLRADEVFGYGPTTVLATDTLECDDSSTRLK